MSVTAFKCLSSTLSVWTRIWTMTLLSFPSWEMSLRKCFILRRERKSQDQKLVLLSLMVFMFLLQHAGIILHISTAIDILFVLLKTDRVVKDSTQKENWAKNRLMKRRHLPSPPQSRTWKDGEDEGIGFESTLSVIKRKTTRTTVRTVEGVIIDVEIIQNHWQNDWREINNDW